MNPAAIGGDAHRPSALIESFYQAALGKRVASFDVFDTAVRRRVAQPTHAFAIAEQSLCDRFGDDTGQDFAQARVDAELTAREIGRREHGHVEVTFDDIFDVLPRLWPRPPAVLAYARQAEMEAELAGIEPEPSIQDVYLRLKAAGIRTIFVSDIYLSEADVRSLLVKSGYDAGDPLFVSSEYRKAKWDGSIWPLVSQRLEVGRSDIVHIGDNKPVDVDTAIRSGLSAFHWPIHDRHRKPAAPVSRWITPLSTLKVLNETQPMPAGDADPFWVGLGRTYGTIIFGSFLRWIAEQVREGVGHVYFCSRDGQILLKLWRELMEPQGGFPPASYLYVSRRALMVPSLHDLDARTLEFLQSGSERRTVRTYLDRVSLLDDRDAVAKAKRLFGSLDKVIETADQRDAMQAYFRSVREELARVAERQREMTDRYLEQEGMFAGGRRVVVDLGWRGNLQRSLADLIESKGSATVLSGLYYGLTREAGMNRGAAGWMHAMIANDFMDAPAEFRLRQMTTILEQLHAADHGTVWEYSTGQDGRVGPVLRSSDIEREQYGRAIAPLQFTAAVELRAIFAGQHSITPEQLNPDSACAALIDLCLYPSMEEVRRIGDLRVLDGFEHSGQGVPVTALLVGLSPEEAGAALKRHTWIAGSIRNWLAARPEILDTVRDLGRRLPVDERWISQFG